MSNFAKNRTLGWICVVIAVVAATVWGMYKKPVDLPKVEFYNWVCDDAKLLSTETENIVKQYNDNWNDRYYAVTAVATVKSVRGWKVEEFAKALGEEWGLGSNDMLLLMVKNGDYYVACGDYVAAMMTDTQQNKLQSAVEPPYYQKDYDDAAVSFFRQADVFYGQAFTGIAGSTGGAEWQKSRSTSLPIGGVILLVLGIFAVWALLDRVRYSRYQRRYVTPAVAVPVIPYYPIFWGRTVASPKPPRPPQPVVHTTSTTYHSGPSHTTTYHSSPRPSTPSHTSSAPRPSSVPKNGSHSGGFGNSGFGGGRRHR